MAKPAKIHYMRANISGLKTRIQEYEDKHYESMIRLIKDAAEEFTWRTVQEIHVDTGMSAASLEPLAQELKTTILDSVTPFVKHRVKGWGTAMTGLSSRGRIKSIEAGIKAGRAAYRFSFGTKRRPVMSFTFRINVWQYAHWEPHWKSLAVGLDRFLQFIENNYDDYIPAKLDEVLNAYVGVK